LLDTAALTVFYLSTGDAVNLVIDLLFHAWVLFSLLMITVPWRQMKRLRAAEDAVAAGRTAGTREMARKEEEIL
jgi:uncharacterized membrane protein